MLPAPLLRSMSAGGTARLSARPRVPHGTNEPPLFAFLLCTCAAHDCHFGIARVTLTYIRGCCRGICSIYAWTAWTGLALSRQQTQTSVYDLADLM